MAVFAVVRPYSHPWSATVGPPAKHPKFVLSFSSPFHTSHRGCHTAKHTTRTTELTLLPCRPAPPSCSTPRSPRHNACPRRNNNAARLAQHHATDEIRTTYLISSCSTSRHGKLPPNYLRVCVCVCVCVHADVINHSLCVRAYPKRTVRGIQGNLARESWEVWIAKRKITTQGNNRGRRRGRAEYYTRDAIMGNRAKSKREKKQREIRQEHTHTHTRNWAGVRDSNWCFTKDRSFKRQVTDPPLWDLSREGAQPWRRRQRRRSRRPQRPAPPSRPWFPGWQHEALARQPYEKEQREVSRERNRDTARTRISANGPAGKSRETRQHTWPPARFCGLVYRRRCCRFRRTWRIRPGDSRATPAPSVACPWRYRTRSSVRSCRQAVGRPEYTGRATARFDGALERPITHVLTSDMMCTKIR